MQPLTTFQNLISYQFKNAQLLIQALTHKSYAFENSKAPAVNLYNERLEFLGDAVLDLAISEMLMRDHLAAEGELSRRRAALVNEKTLAHIAKDLKLSEFLILGKGEISSQGAHKDSIQSSGLESVIGAIFEDGGYSSAKEVVERFFKKYIEAGTFFSEHHFDFKTKLQEKWQAKNKSIPTYILDRTEGPDHQKVFYVSVYVEDKKQAEGFGKSRKEAEQSAAEQALKDGKES